MQIKRDQEQIQKFGRLQLTELYDEAEINPHLFFPKQYEENVMSESSMIARMNNANSIHKSNEFETIFESESYRTHLFYLKGDEQENVLQMEFSNHIINISDDVSFLLEHCTKLAANLNARLLDRFGKEVVSPQKKKSLFGFLGFLKK